MKGTHWIKWTWIIMAFMGIIVFKIAPEDTATQALIIGGMGLVHGVWTEYKLEELKKDIDYK